MRSIKKRMDHMESLQGDVMEICPETGERIEPVEIPKKFVVKRYLMYGKNMPHPLDKYKKMTVKNMTDEQIDSAYKIIKRITKCKIV